MSVIEYTCMYMWLKMSSDMLLTGTTELTKHENEEAWAHNNSVVNESHVATHVLSKDCCNKSTNAADVWRSRYTNVSARPQPSLQALVSQQCKKNSTVQQLVPVITLVTTTSNDFIRDCMSHAAASAGLVLSCWPYIIPSEKTKMTVDQIALGGGDFEV